MVARISPAPLWRQRRPPRAAGRSRRRRRWRGWQLAAPWCSSWAGAVLLAALDAAACGVRLLLLLLLQDAPSLVHAMQLMSDGHFSINIWLGFGCEKYRSSGHALMVHVITIGGPQIIDTYWD